MGILFYFIFFQIMSCIYVDKNCQEHFGWDFETYLEVLRHHILLTANGIWAYGSFENLWLC